MTSTLKKIGAFSPDAIETALQITPLSTETVAELKRLSEALAKPEQHVKSPKHKRVSDDELFSRTIAPKIKERVTKYLLTDQDVVIPSLQPLRNPMRMSLTRLIAEIKTITELEASMKLTVLVTQYYRGLLYLAAHTQFDTHEGFKQWLFTHFRISYVTATRYMTVTCLLKKFPTLFVAELTFSTLLRHNKRIRHEFKDNDQVKRSIVILGDTGQRICSVDQFEADFLQNSINLDHDFEFRGCAEDSSMIDSRNFQRLADVKMELQELFVDQEFSQ